MIRCNMVLPLAASISLSLLPMLACTNSVESRSISSRIDRASERWYGLFQDNLDSLHPDDQWGIGGFAEGGRLRLSYYELFECADCPQRSVETLVLGDYADKALPFVLIEFSSGGQKKGTGVRFGASRSPSIPVTSKRHVFHQIEPTLRQRRRVRVSRRSRVRRAGT